MSWVLYVLYLFIFLYLVYRLRIFRLEGLPAWMPPAFFIVKVMAGFALWGIYTFYYTDRSTSDIWKYYDDSKVMYSALHEHPGDYFRMLSGIGDHTPRIQKEYYDVMNHWNQRFNNSLFNDGHCIIRINAALLVFSLGNYHTHSLFFCFLAFIGLCAVYKTFYPVLKQWAMLSSFIIFLLPSMVFWSSGVLKEAIVIAALGGLLFHAFRFFEDNHALRIPAILFCAWILFLTKFYVLAAAVPGLLAAWWIVKQPLAPFAKYSIVLLLFVSGGISLHFIAPKHDPMKMMAQRQRDFLRLAHGGTYLLNDSIVAYISPAHHSDFIKDSATGTVHIRTGVDFCYWKIYPDFGDTLFTKNNRDTSRFTIMTDQPPAGSLVKSVQLQPTVGSFLKAAPGALVHTLFRPWPWEAGSLLLILPMLENLFFISLLVLFILFYRRPTSFPHAFFCLAFVVLLLLVTGYTTPVLGAIVRYRVMAQPFLLLMLLMMIDRERMLRKKEA